jgi:DNA repair photolyase
MTQESDDLKEWIGALMLGSPRGYSYPISQHKSFLGVDTFIGCNAGCAYCFRYRKEIIDPRRTCEDREIVDGLLQHPFFVRGVTPLSVNSNSTDPFHAAVRASTLDILDMLESSGITNPITLITKVPLPEQEIQRLHSSSKLNLDVNVSYSAMPEEVEPISANARIDFMKRLAEAPIRVALFARPIVADWNATAEHFRAIFHAARLANVGAIIVGGLRLSDGIRSNIRRSGLAIPLGHAKDYKKYLPAELKDLILEVYREMGMNTPLVRRASCGRALIRPNMPDFNAHWDEPERNCWSSCPVAQQRICHDQAARVPSAKSVFDLLNRIGKEAVGFEILPTGVLLKESLPVFMISYLRLSLRFPVNACTGDLSGDADPALDVISAAHQQAGDDLTRTG